MPSHDESNTAPIEPHRNPYHFCDRGRRDPLRLFANVTPGGFRIEGAVVPELSGRIMRIRFVRKHFIDGCLACYSADAISTREGYYCDVCGITTCRSYLRVQLWYNATIYTIDLPPSSAKNLARLEENALFFGELIIDVPLRLTVANQGDWGEVRFKCL
jgi:hypothetical protein